MIEKTKKLIGIINDVHLQYSRDYFETGKIEKFSQNTDKYPVNNWMNDIFGARMILTEADIKIAQDLLYDWQEEFGLKNWYLRDKDGYKGLHIYFKNKSNFYFPWELQLWDENDVEKNIESHRQLKRDFVK
jgi:hypothetical protein